MSELITVNVKLKEVLHFDEDIELTQEEFDKLQKHLEDNGDSIYEYKNSELYNLLQSRIDLQNPTDSDGEYSDVDIIKL